MSEGNVKAAAPAGRNAAVVMAAGGVIGFSAGWGLTMALGNPDLRLFLGVVGLVVGASVGWLVGRMATKAAA